MRSGGLVITVVVYAIVLAAAAFMLEWLEYRYTIREMGTDAYIIALAAGFVVLGIWVGARLTRPGVRAEFEKNEAAQRSLGITEREFVVLELLAAGRANKEIARELEVSPNTVKTHVSSLYGKLGVVRRTQAVDKARLLRLIP